MYSFQQKKQCEETHIDRQARFHKASETKKRKRLEETNNHSEQQIRFK
jgi:hypothetical protein